MIGLLSPNIESLSITEREISLPNSEVETSCLLGPFRARSLYFRGSQIPSESETIFFTAPEIFDCALGIAGGYSFAVDWWSLGVTAYELVRGKRPLDIQMNDELAQIRNHFRGEVLYPVVWSSGFKHLLSRVRKNYSKNY